VWPLLGDQLPYVVVDVLDRRAADKRREP